MTTKTSEDQRLPSRDLLAPHAPFVHAPLDHPRFGSSWRDGDLVWVGALLSVLSALLVIVLVRALIA